MLRVLTKFRIQAYLTLRMVLDMDDSVDSIRVVLESVEHSIQVVVLDERSSLAVDVSVLPILVDVALQLAPNLINVFVNDIASISIQPN